MGQDEIIAQGRADDDEAIARASDPERKVALLELCLKHERELVHEHRRYIVEIHRTLNEHGLMTPQQGELPARH